MTALIDLLAAARDALQHHTDQTRPIWRTNEVIVALDAALTETTTAKLAACVAAQLAFQSSGASPTIHDYGRWRRVYDECRAASHANPDKGENVNACKDLASHADPEGVRLAAARDALEEIALAGMSGSGQESPEGLREWHARRAWEFIGIAARALDAIKAAAPAPAVQAVAPADALDSVATVCTLDIKTALHCIRDGRPEAAIRPLEHALGVTVETARAALAAAAPVAPQAAPAPIHVEAVAEVVLTAEGNRLDWLVEGGIAAMEYGSVLVLASEPITDDDGSGEVYRAAPVAQPLTPLKDKQISATYIARDAKAGASLADLMHAAVAEFCRINNLTLASTAAGREGGAA